MKKIILFAALLFTFKTFASSDAGGMDGGGGGTLPTHPVSIYQIQNIVYKAKPRLLYIFNAYEQDPGYVELSQLQKKLYLGPRRVQDVLNDLRVEVKTDAPCLTSQGTEVDGSIHGSKPNTICISAQRISKKVDAGVADREILALLAHEVSHFMGADEAEATEIQKDIAWRILVSSEKSDFDSVQALNTYSEFFNFLGKTIDELQLNHLVEAEKWFSWQEPQLFEFDRVYSSFVYKVFNIRENYYQRVLRLKLDWAYIYLRSQMDGSEHDYFRQEYRKKFEGRDYFLVIEEDPQSKNFYNEEKIYKLNSNAELNELLKSLSKEFRVRLTYLMQSTYGNNWLSVNGHLTKTFNNPWKNFVGNYKVTDAQCTANGDSHKDIKEIKISRIGGDLFFGQVFSNGSANDKIELGASHVSTTLNDYGLISPTQVYMTTERGGSWNDDMYIDRMVSKTTLENFQDQTFKITIQDLIEPKEITKPDTKSTCVLSGTLQN